jgi:hypothetical protein
MTDQDLIDGIKQKIYDGRPSSFLEKPSTVQRIAKSKGWHVGAKDVWVKEWNPRGSRVKLISNDPLLAGMTTKARAEELLPDGERLPLNVVAKADELF